MKIYEVENRSKRLIEALLKVWEDSVRATHLFLSDKEIEQIKAYVPQVLGGVTHLIIAKNESDEPMAFMGIENDRLEMLFISPQKIGHGIGGKLLEYGIQNYGICEVTVNEQYPQAVGFYQHMGFKTYKRTDFDEQGNPYPLLYMRLR